jgi:hypothetical protein
MNPTTTDVIRRRIVVAGLIAGPLLLLVSTAFATSNEPSARAVFDAIAANPWMPVTESLLEAIGFTVAFACYAGATQALRSRGGALGTVGAVLCMLGVLGFTLSASAGLFLSMVAGMSDEDAGFAAASAIQNGSPAEVVAMVLMLLGEAGICLIIGGLLRAHLVPIWPLLLVLAGVVADNLPIGPFSTIASDALLLAASVWVAVLLARTPRPVWLGEPRPAQEPAVVPAA